MVSRCLERGAVLGRSRLCLAKALSISFASSYPTYKSCCQHSEERRLTELHFWLDFGWLIFRVIRHHTNLTASAFNFFQLYYWVRLGLNITCFIKRAATEYTMTCTGEINGGNGTVKHVHINIR